MGQNEIIDYCMQNKGWHKSVDLARILPFSRTSIIRSLTKLSAKGLLIRKRLKLRGYEYKANVFGIRKYYGLPLDICPDKCSNKDIECMHCVSGSYFEEK